MTNVEQIEQIEARVSSRARWRQVVICVACVLIGILLTVGLYAFKKTERRVETQKAEKETAQDAADTNADAAEALCAQVRKLGGQCVVNPNTLPKPEASPGEPGPGPSDAEVRAAVANYFSRNPVPVGRNPTPSEIALAVITYLRQNPPSAGEPGEGGAVGPMGPMGPEGPGPSADQIADAVREYLTANPPPSGPEGPRGPGPTPAEVAEAVRQYIMQNPLPMCPEGSSVGRLSVLTTSEGPRDIITCVPN